MRGGFGWVWRWSIRTRSPCRDHWCCFPLEHASNNWVFLSVHECIFFFLQIASYIATLLAQNGINIPSSSFIGWHIRTCITPILIKAHNLKLRATWRAGWQPSCWSWKQPPPHPHPPPPHLSMALVIASHQSSPSRARARPFSNVTTGSRQLPRGRVHIRLIIAMPTHWRPFHGGWVIPAKSQRGTRD